MRGSIYSALEEIIFSENTSGTLELKTVTLADAADTTSDYGANKIDCKEQFVRFSVGRPRRGPAPDTISVEVEYADARDV